MKEGLRLRVAGLTEGDKDVAQALLVPEEALRAEHEYLVRLHGAKPGEPKEFHPTVVQEGKPVRMQWHIGPAPDTTAPSWKEAPRVLGTRRDEKGSHGAETRVRVAVAAQDEGGPILYRVALRARAVSPDWRSWLYTAPEDGVLDVGRAKWGGPFTLATGRRYEMKLFAVDAAGNEREAPGAPLRFKGPRVRHAR